MLTWLDPTSPAVRSAVVSGEWGKQPHSPHQFPVPDAESGEIDTIATALAVASDTLSAATFLAVHPAGVAVEEFVCHPGARRLSLTFGPVRGIRSLTGREGLTLSPQWSVGAGMVWINDRRMTISQWYGLCCGGWRETELLTLTYRFGSTISPGARRAVLLLAHELWLAGGAGCDECGPCQLPANTTSVLREGLQLTMDPEGKLIEDGKTGLPAVDAWLAIINPRGARGVSRVYDETSPVGVVTSIQHAYTSWPA